MFGIVSTIVLGLLRSLFGLYRSSSTGISLGAATDTVTIPGTLTATLSLTSGATISGGAISLNDSSNFNTTINTGTSTGTVTIGNSAAGVVTLANKANTAATFLVTDGTTTLLGLDTRIGTSGVKTFAFQPPASLSFASAAGNAYSLASLSAFTLSQTGATTITALNGLSLVVNSPTVSNAAGAALTATTVSAVQINGPLPTTSGGGSMTFTNAFALDIPTFANNGTVAAGLRVAAPTGATTNYCLALSAGTRAAPAIWFSGGAQTGIYGAGTNTIGMAAGGNGSFVFGSATLTAISGVSIGWTSNGSDANNAQDTSFSRLAAGVVGVTSWLQNTAGTDRVNAAAVTATDATMVNITALSKTVIAGRKYVGKITLFANNSTNTDGLKFDLGGGTATFTSLEFGFAAQPAGSTLGTVTSTNPTTAITLTIVSTSDAVYEISFGFVCNAAGTVIPRFAEVTDGGGTATVQIQSFILMQDSPT